MEYLPSFTDGLHADIQPSYTDFLMHHGIKGQKWGVRRFQNSDGSLTREGQKRYNGYFTKTGKDPNVVYDKKYGNELWNNKYADKGDKLRANGLTGDESFTLTKKQKIGFGLTAPVTFPVALAADIQQKKAIQASKRREYYTNLEKREKEYRLAQQKAQRDLKERQKQQQNEFESVFGKNKKFNYLPIYKEMNADMSIDDNDYYKEVYYEWRKKHGFTD